jgi:hypothetical protein
MRQVIGGVVAAAVLVSLASAPASAQQGAAPAPPSQHAAPAAPAGPPPGGPGGGHGMMGGGMMGRGGMERGEHRGMNMCDMMMAAHHASPREMQMHGEIMKAIGEILVKYGKQAETQPSR